jgi:hypothetical protein
MSPGCASREAAEYCCQLLLLFRRRQRCFLASETSSALDAAGCIEFLILEQSMKGVWIGTRGPIANA